jgi:hydroxymethylpyrimidine pyrophosphatase-like HAD family hydrolase
LRVLVVTEKCGPRDHERDGGSRLVATLKRVFGDAVAVAQFGSTCDGSAEWHFQYPVATGDRFTRRLANAHFIAERVRELTSGFTHVAFIHVSMQFGFADEPLDGAETWTFPMFLTPSYQAAGELVPAGYAKQERAALRHATCVVTPSHLERRQLVELYGVEPWRIRVVPRGVELSEGIGCIREKQGPLVLAAVGSIKRQKNVFGLLQAFAKIRDRHPGAILRVVGGVQDPSYEASVLKERTRLQLADSVDFVGYVPPSALPAALADAHLHLSASLCETFGRAIFETLALGLPNVALASWNAASEYLRDVPYARFVENAEGIPDAVDALLEDLPQRSAMAQEVGGLFGEGVLSGLLLAELRKDGVLAVSDWDGTLFHKGDAHRTRRSIDAFRRYPRRVLCTARGVTAALCALAEHDLDVDWIVGHGGAVIADGRGAIIHRQTLAPDQVHALLSIAADACAITHEGEVVQVSTASEHFRLPLGCRAERYQGVSFVSHWDSSKLRGVLRLLRHVGSGVRVRAFGDGVYDEELLTYFDGVLIRGSRPVTSSLVRVVGEVSDVC